MPAELQTRLQVPLRSGPGAAEPSELGSEPRFHLQQDTMLQCDTVLAEQLHSIFEPHVAHTTLYCNCAAMEAQVSHPVGQHGSCR